MGQFRDIEERCAECSQQYSAFCEECRDLYLYDLEQHNKEHGED